MKSTIQIISIIFFFYQITASFDDSYFCSNDINRFTSNIKPHMVRGIGKGAFGQIFGDGTTAVKKLKVVKYDNRGEFYLKNEIANMILMHSQFDYVKVPN